MGRRTVRRRQRGPLFHARHAEGFDRLVDVSMPSVLAAEVRELDGIEVLDLDGIADLVDAEEQRRTEQLALCDELVAAAPNPCTAISPRPRPAPPADCQ